MSGRWEFWIDRGGTFTDVVGKRPDGRLVTEKLLSHDPDRYRDAAVAGVRRMLGVAEGEPVPADRVETVKMGTTVATNALLERAGEPTVLVTTAGFRDALRIAYQNRPRLFDRHIVLPEVLYDHVIEVDERVAADGQRLRPLDAAATLRQLRQAYAAGTRSAAVVTLHGYRHPEHEEQIARLAREVGFTQVSCSHEVSPLIKLVPRGDTTVVDAYLSPVLSRYVQQVASELSGIRLMFMQSGGGLREAGHFRGKDAVLSGPAGGVVGMARSCAEVGHHRVIGFDMGGTSTDVSHYAGELERTLDTQVAGVRMRAPMMDIHTVAAGGGSVLHFDGARFRVGPDSAGADPGPACYRKGGPLTVTDANVMLGRVQPAHFPPVFGPAGDQRLDAEVVRARFAELAAQTRRAAGARAAEPRTAERVAAGFLEIAVLGMANAVKKISVQRGHDITRYALASFGGAGGQHACAVADALGVRTVIVPPMAGVLSAYGIGVADAIAMREQSVERELNADSVLAVRDLCESLARRTTAELTEGGVPAASVHTAATLHLRYEGTDAALGVGLDELTVMNEEFQAAHRARYGFTMDKPLIAATVVVEARGAAGGHAPQTTATGETGVDPRPVDRVRMYCADSWRETPLFQRADLAAGDTVTGPAVIAEADATTVVEDGWRATTADGGHLLLTRVTARPVASAIGTEVDPVKLEVFNNLFMAVAEQMGLRLENTAHSVNIKERLDFSCAVFDDEGDLIANAPHIPVHLGSMGESIKEVLRRNRGTMRKGDVYAINDPYHGGTHLPDVTVVTPVFDTAGEHLLFLVASRGHHAEIGGLTPGSMPAFSRSVTEEGILFDNWLLVRDGSLRENETRQLLLSGPHPSRNPAANLADLRAQIAANEKGIAELHGMIDQFGIEVVQAYMRHVQDNAEESVRRIIATLEDGHHRYETDSGAVIEVSVTIDRENRSAALDFTGTSPQCEDNFNAPRSVVMAAVLYVFRTLVADDIPLNSGCLVPLSVTIPRGSMLWPLHPAATVAGNVETSQAVTGALYAALGVQAEGSGTMNNVTFGNDRVQYYETLASGSGAGQGFAGTTAVQTHMTNSRLTDPEILEWRYPVRVEEFRVRTGSGGRGRWPGGDGVVRRLRFLEPMTLALLTGHRRVAPYPMAGGFPGALGRNAVEHADGRVTELGSVASAEVDAGDVLLVETPGGGGYGPLEPGD